MKPTTFFLIALILFIGLANPFQANAQSMSIEQMASLSEDEIDIGIVALTLAKEVFPETDIYIYSEKIDQIVEGVRSVTMGVADPDFRVRALNTYLYRTLGIAYDLSDPYVKNLKNRYLTGILNTKKGSCVSMPLLYLSVAQRLGYPVYPVCVPAHMFLRYVDPNLKMQNIEATGGGGYSPDEEYIETLQISSLALSKGTYLRTLTYRELLGLLIEQNGIYWGRKGENLKAIKYLETAVKLNPRGADSIRSLGVAYHIQSKKEVGKLSQEYLVKAQSCFQKAAELGVTQISNTNYIETQRKAQQAFRAKQKQQDKMP